MPCWGVEKHPVALFVICQKARNGYADIYSIERTHRIGTAVACLFGSGEPVVHGIDYRAVHLRVAVGKRLVHTDEDFFTECVFEVLMQFVEDSFQPACAVRFLTAVFYVQETVRTPNVEQWFVLETEQVFVVFLIFAIEIGKSQFDVIVPDIFVDVIQIFDRISVGGSISSFRCVAAV